MNNDFYKAFEDKFRGTRDSIKSRLQVYLPFIEAIQEIYPDAQATDLGCGRGEWLEILTDYRFAAKGVDLDDSMLSVCREVGLDIQKDDALSYLNKLKDNSQAIVSAFHLVEHLSFEDLRKLVAEAMRVLKPAGLLILETPNPENLVVGTCNFYLDPTHRHPIPPKLLAFTTEYYGFENVKILRLQDPIKSSAQDHVSLFTVLNGVSPDYAVVAQKSANNKLLNSTREAFSVDHGVTLEQLATSYDLKLENIRHELSAVYSSRSWRITRPMRWFLHQTRLLRERGVIDRLKALIRRIVSPLIRNGLAVLDSQPKLRSRMVWLIKKLGLYKLSRNIYFKLQPPFKSTQPLYGLNDLSAHARCIYHDLETVVANAERSS